ncbi:MAG: hypothetical protein M1319_07215 [Chloroflexi bacterium]|nr:hypothetical protein [Chloroflexota bacterium]
MSLLLGILGIYVPPTLKRRNLAELFACTASAFGVEHPPLAGLTHTQILREYAMFTSREAEKAVASGEDIDYIKERLHANAYQLGSRLRRIVNIRTMADVMAMARVLYKVLDIDFRGSPDGAIEIGPCYFSKFYSGEVCHVMSAVDEGVLAGLSGGGWLLFSQRITEGSKCCRAAFVSGREVLCQGQ